MTVSATHDRYVDGIKESVSNESAAEQQTMVWCSLRFAFVAFMVYGTLWYLST